MDTDASFPQSFPTSFQHHYTFSAGRDENHWDQMYSAWQARDQLRQRQEQVLEAERLRVFGGEAGDEISLLEPMLRVVTDLFDGNTDYEDP